MDYAYCEAKCKTENCETRILVWADNKAYDRTGVPFPVPLLFLSSGGVSRTCPECLQRHFYTREDCDCAWKHEPPADML
jgi:hypothetical protein